MKEARNLLLLLDVNYATIRHVQVVANFLNSGETDVKVLLDSLGT